MKRLWRLWRCSSGASKGWGGSTTAMLNDRLRLGCSRHPTAITCHRMRSRRRRRRRVHPSPTRSRHPPRPPRGRIADPVSSSSRTRGLFHRRRGVRRRRWPLEGSRRFADAVSRGRHREPSRGRSPRNTRMLVKEEETNDEVRRTHVQGDDVEWLRKYLLYEEMFRLEVTWLSGGTCSIVISLMLFCFFVKTRRSASIF